MDNRDNAVSEPANCVQERRGKPARQISDSGGWIAAFSMFCFYCALVWCVHLLSTSGEPSEDMGVLDATLGVMIVLPAVFGTLTCVLLGLVSVVFPKRPAKKLFWFLALGINLLTIALLSVFRWLGPLVLNMLDHS